MKITIKATNLDLTPSLNTYIENKLGTLARLVKKFDSEGLADARIEVARTTRHHHKGDVFMAEINLHLGGKTLRITEKNEDIRKAIDIAKHKLHQEIEKFKSKSDPVRKKTK
ncbi:MAG: ribosome-associated translation inhibitor RaiA [Patescibacteria group bacterium]